MMDSSCGRRWRAVCASSDERLFRIVQHAQQHRQVQSRHAVHVHAESAQAVGDVARRRAVEIGEHQHAIAVIEIARTRRRVAQGRIGSAFGGTSCMSIGSGMRPSMWRAAETARRPSLRG